MIITISGLPGSGKSSTSQLLSQKLNLKVVSVGEIFRQMAKENKMTLAEFSKYCEKHPEVDLELDKRTRKLGETEANIIIEGRITGWLCPSSFKVWLDASIETRAKRVSNRTNQVSETKKHMLEREKSEAKRYKEFYKVDLHDKSTYDLVVDSENLNIEQMVALIISEIRKRNLK